MEVYTKLVNTVLSNLNNSVSEIDLENYRELLENELEEEKLKFWYQELEYALWCIEHNGSYIINGNIYTRIS